jgi:hypothetical protein
VASTSVFTARLSLLLGGLFAFREAGMRGKVWFHRSRAAIWIFNRPSGQRHLSGGHMLRTWIRRYLGITNLEVTMASAAQQLTELKTQFSDFASDVNAKLDQLNTAQGDFTPEAQQVFDELRQAVADADGRIGDADGSDTPAADEASDR